MSKKPLLSISILISNRPDTVEKCLSSLNTLREKVSSELILVDTGCGEEVRKTVEKYADKIVDFVWCNDFAKARNAGLKEATGEWFLFMDDDEWFEDTAEIEEFFLAGDYKRYNYAYYCIRNYHDFAGKTFDTGNVGRLVKKTPELRFIYAVHEQFNVVHEPIKRLHSYVHHYGYAYKNEEARRKHFERNATILKDVIEKDPYVIKFYYQLGIEYLSVNEVENALEIFRKGLELCEQGKIKSYLQYASAICAYFVQQATNSEQYSKAIEYGKKYETYRLNELTRAFMHLHLAQSYLHEGLIKESLSSAEIYLKAWAKWNQNQEIYINFELPLMFHCMEEECHQYALNVMLSALLLLHRDEDAYEVWGQSIKLSEEKNINYKDTIVTITKLWIEDALGERPFLQEMIEYYAERDQYSHIIQSELDSIRKEQPERLRQKKNGWDKLKTLDWQYAFLQLWAYLSEEKIEIVDREKIYPDFQVFWKDTRKSLPISIELGLWEMAENAGYSMEEVIKSIPLYRWEKGVSVAMSRQSDEQLAKLNANLIAKTEANNINTLYWRQSYFLDQLLKLAEETEKETEIYSLLKEYAEINIDLYGKLYKEELFQEHREVLPYSCQISLLLENIISKVDEHDLVAALQELKELVEFAPELAKPLKQVSEYIQKQSQAKKNDNNLELLLLANQMKEKILLLLDNGMVEEAKNVVSQMRQLMPQDEDFIQLEIELLG